MGKGPYRLRMAWCAVVLVPPSLAVADNKPSIVPDEIVTVVAHRQTRGISEIAGTVSVISAEDLGRDMVLNASDLVRYEMGVELDASSSRFGHNGFRIRGIGGNRTAVVVDHIAIPDRFSVGSFSDTGRGLLDLGLANRVEILRGPASTLYGSDALGGVVAIKTLAAEDVLYNANEGVWLRTGYASDAQRAYGRVATAVSHGNHSVLIAAATQNRDEYQAAGLSASERDPQQVEQTGAMFKWNYYSNYGEFEFSLDGLREQRETEIRHSLGTGRQRNTTSLLGDDERFQWRAILRLQSEPNTLADRGEWRLFLQQAETTQNSLEQRALLAEPLTIYRGFRYDYDSIGVAADLESDFMWAALAHRLGYGFEVSRAEVWDQRDAWQQNHSQQSVTKTLLGETFPLPDFPRSHIHEVGLYVHDDIKLWQGGPTLSPGLRYERYALRTQTDELYAERFPFDEPTDLTHSAWLPKLGLLWPINDSAEWFAQYARGYRAPPFADVNVGLYYPQFKVLAIANPDLKPERGATFETGIRWRSQYSNIALTAYHNRYHDFIESRAAQGYDPVRDLLIFQSINRDKVVIEGIEFSWEQHWHEQWFTQVWLQASKGVDAKSKTDLPTIAPPSLLTELRYEASSGTWDSRLILRAQRGQRQLFDASSTPLFAAPGYTTLDWLWQWYPNSSMTIGFGAFNLTDKTYWQATQVGGYEQNDRIIPLLAQPGRHVRASFDMRF